MVELITSNERHKKEISTYKWKQLEMLKREEHATDQEEGNTL